MSFFNSIMDTGTKAFKWMEDNPTAASFIGGAAVGLLQYQSAKEERDFERELRDEQWARQDQYGGASTTSAGKEPSNALTGGSGSLTGGGGSGSLTDGNITSFADALGR